MTPGADNGNWVTNRWAVPLIWALAGVGLVVSAVAVGVHVAELRALASPQLPWWALALGFAAAERAVVHLHFRRSAHSVTLGDIPWVLGLIFASAPQLLVGALIGSVATWIFDRRLPPVKVVFNISQLAVAICIAETIIHTYTGEANLMRTGLWLVTLAAIEAGGPRVGRNDQRRDRPLRGQAGAGHAARMFAIDLVITAANTALALVAAVVIHEDSEPRH